MGGRNHLLFGYRRQEGPKFNPPSTRFSGGGSGRLPGLGAEGPREGEWGECCGSLCEIRIVPAALLCALTPWQPLPRRLALAVHLLPETPKYVEQLQIWLF